VRDDNPLVRPIHLLVRCENHLVRSCHVPGVRDPGAGRPGER